MDYFNIVMGANGLLEVEDLSMVYNPDLVSNFNNSAKTLRKRHQESADIFAKTSWKAKPDMDHREWVISNYQQKVNQYFWNRENEELKALPIIPVLHGTAFLVAEKIIQTGFAMTAALYLF